MTKCKKIGLGVPMIGMSQRQSRRESEKRSALKHRGVSDDKQPTTKLKNTSKNKGIEVSMKRRKTKK